MKPVALAGVFPTFAPQHYVRHRTSDAVSM
jgi:hypothetical protein